MVLVLNYDNKIVPNQPKAEQWSVWVIFAILFNILSNGVGKRGEQSFSMLYRL